MVQSMNRKSPAPGMDIVQVEVAYRSLAGEAWSDSIHVLVPAGNDTGLAMIDDNLAAGLEDLHWCT